MITPAEAKKRARKRAARVKQEHQKRRVKRFRQCIKELNKELIYGKGHATCNPGYDGGIMKALAAYGQSKGYVVNASSSTQYGWWVTFESEM